MNQLAGWRRALGIELSHDRDDGTRCGHKSSHDPDWVRQWPQRNREIFPRFAWSKIGFGLKTKELGMARLGWHYQGS